MAVILYQLIIVSTLLAVRVIAPRRLLPACLIWSALTVINVFWPPLIAVQLLVIWITYGTIQPAEKKSASRRQSGSTSKTAPSTSNAAAQQQRPVASSATEPLSPVSQTAQVEVPTRPTLSAMLRQWDDHLARMNAINAACAPLLSVCFTERLRIEAALEQARARLQIERKKNKDPDFAAAYEEQLEKVREEMRRASATLDDGAPEPELEVVVCGDLTVLPRHPDARVENGIREKIEPEISTYASLLSKLVVDLRDPDLKRVFEKSLAELNAADLLLRISAFGKTGVDWRNPVECQIAAEESDVTPRAKEARPGRVAAVAPLSSELEAAVNERDIPWLVHFTHAQNLKSIFEHGLCSVTAARLFGIKPKVNDKQRLDGHPWGISLSIAAPNHKMFYKYRALDEHEDWAVLLIDRAVLWKKDCAFYPRNAADHRMRALPLAGQKTRQAFESMYESLEGLPSRESQQLKRFDPTDPQAEVLVFDRIEPDMIVGVAFESATLQAQSSRLSGKRETRLYPKGKGPFGAREFNTL